MAAIVYPFGEATWERAPRDHCDAPRLRLIEGEAGGARTRRTPRRHPSVLPLAATVAALVGTWFGAGALTSSHASRLVVPAHAVRVEGGYRYTVQPGDTLWSIASRLDPNGDPRPLVDRLTAEVDGSTIRPGEQLLVP